MLRFCMNNLSKYELDVCIVLMRHISNGSLESINNIKISNKRIADALENQ